MKGLVVVGGVFAMAVSFGGYTPESECFAGVAEPEVSVLRMGREALVRSSFSEREDLLVHVRSGANEWVYFVPKGLPTADFKKGELFHPGGDDYAAVNLGDFGYLSGNHGSYFVHRQTVKDHGLTADAVGSVVRHESGETLVLFGVPDKDHLLLHPEGKDGANPCFKYLPTGRFTCGERSWTPSETSREQMSPLNRYRRFRWQLADGGEVPDRKEVKTTGVDLVLEHDVLDPRAVMRYVKAHPGKSGRAFGSNISGYAFADTPDVAGDADYMAIPSLMTVKTTMRYDGRCCRQMLRRTTFNAEIRSGFMLDLCYGWDGAERWGDVDFYMPRTNPFSLKDRKTGADIPCDFTAVMKMPYPPWNVDYSLMRKDVTDPANPPDRFIRRMTEGKRQVGLALGYSLLNGLSALGGGWPGRDRIYNFWRTGKMYPCMMDIKDAKPGDTYEHCAYTQYFDPAHEPDATAFYAHRDGDALVVYMDFHKTLKDKRVVLPPEAAGCAFRVLEKTPSVTLKSDRVAEDGSVVLDVADGYGTLVLAVQPPTGRERPYGFRVRLATVHEPGRRNPVLRPQTNEFCFTDGCVVPDADFADYLRVSMGVGARTGEDGCVSLALDASLPERAYRIEVCPQGVAIRAYDRRAATQAFCHLEDLMNLRRAPFLACGVETRRSLFSPRMVHSGWGLDEFPDAYLAQMAHHGLDAILIFLRDVDTTQGGGANAHVNDIVERALAFGIDTYLYSKVQGFVHPDDPAGAAVLRDSFGRVAAAHPKAKGIVFVGESCQFPSRDPRVQPVRHQDRNLADPRPLAGWFPCRDYPDWLRAVMAAVHARSPHMEIVFWTYNWSEQPVDLCADAVGRFPDGVAVLSTFGKGEVARHRNGLENDCSDYTVSFPGPTRHYAAEAAAAGAHGRRLYAMSNTGGLTWDFGVVPYLPCPYQWKRRWDALRASQAKDGLSGLMESHHYGWTPSFVSELAKEAFTEGGMPFEEHVLRIAARDFGEENAARVLAVWRRWSEAADDYVATNENQYGPFRIGPAYPFSFGGETVASGAFPQDPKGTFTMRWMAYLNYPYDQRAADLLNIVYRPLSETMREREMELLRSAEAAYREGARVLSDVASSLDARRRQAAERQAGLGAFMGCTVRTAINLRLGLAAHAKGDAEALLDVARDEYANAKAALALVEADSRLGWEPSMCYAGGPVQLRWKIARMERTYGRDLLQRRP